MKMQFAGTLAAVGLAWCAAAPTPAVAADANAQSDATYVAELRPLNSNVTGSEATGEARFTIRGDTLTISVHVRGVPPDMMHLQHFHGFTDDRPASCPTAAADKNGDGIIDLIETEPFSGTTMVPFNGDPVAMTIVSETYPKASADGTLSYEKSVPLGAMADAFASMFKGQKLDLDRRVVYIHGVPPSTKLPPSVASLDGIPAQVTLPIACGKIVRAEP